VCGDLETECTERPFQRKLLPGHDGATDSGAAHPMKTTDYAVSICASRTRAIASSRSIGDGFPLEIYERAIDASPARHVRLLHVCRSDDALTRTLFGVTESNVASGVLVDRAAEA